jgi:hypothetical protein
MRGRHFSSAGRLGALGAVTVVAFSLVGMSVAVAAPSTVSKPVADPGSYGGSAGGLALTFFVSLGSRSVLDISMPVSALTCSPGGKALSDTTFVIAKVALGGNDAFSAKASQDGIFSGDSTRFSYSVAGRFSKATKQHTATAAGSLREDMSYTDRSGVHHLCTTKNLTWTARRSGPSPRSASLVKAGNYGGLADGRALGFAVKSRRVNTIYFPSTGLICSPGGGLIGDTTFVIPHTAIKPDGSFSALTSRTGRYAGARATFRYFFSGDFQGPNASGVVGAAGIYREDIAYTAKTGIHRTCTTNTKAWVVVRTS